MSHSLSRRIVEAPRRVVLLLTLLLAPGLTLAADDPPDNAGGAKLSRVVVAGGSLTEILYALHLQDHIAAVDTTSLFPSEALKAKPNIGYVRAMSAEGILALGPSLLLAIEGAGPPGTLDIIRSAGVSVVTVPDDPSQTGIARKIEDIGHLFGVDAAAQSLTRDVTAAFASLATSRGRIAHPKRVLFVLALQNGRSMVGGRKTSADGMIQLAGGINAAGEIEGFKPMSDEAILAAAPDVVLTMQNAGPAVTADALFALPAYAGTPAGQSRSLVSMDGLLLLGFGPRTPEAAQRLLTVLYPDLLSAKS